MPSNTLFKKAVLNFIGTDDKVSSFVVLNKQSFRRKKFVKKFFEKTYAQLFDNEPLIEKNADDEYRELKNRKMRREVDILERKYIDIDDVLAFISSANSIFKGQQEQLEKSIIEQIADDPDPEKIKKIFEDKRKVYSSDELYRMIYD